MNNRNDVLSHDDLNNEIDDFGDDPDESLLMEFLDQWENASEISDRDAILEEFCAKHRHLEGNLRDLAEARAGVDRVDFFSGEKDADPDQLGPYRIIRLLAHGGMGKVYEAEEKTPLRRVAVKTIRLGRAANLKLVEQFKAEREALAKLHHTNIVPIFSAGEEDGLLYFAMPLINGLTLADLVATMSQPGSLGQGKTATTTPMSSWADVLKLARTEASHRHTLERLSARFGVRMSRAPSARPSPSSDHKMPIRSPIPRPPDYERRVAEIIAVAAEAIHSAHEAGVLHLDVKPSNILIEPVSKTDPMSLHPWVIDFGLVDVANTLNGDDPAGSTNHSHRTRGFGTKGFMAPEMIVIRDAEREAAVSDSDIQPPIARTTDIWSLGVTLYQLLTLRLPFTSDQQTIGAEAPIPPHQHVPAISRELEAVVLKALQKRPEDRYSSAGEFAKDIRRWLAGFPTAAGKANHPKRVFMWVKRRPAAAFAAGMTVTCALVASLGAGQAVSRDRAEAAMARAETHIVEQDLKAKKHELNALNQVALSRLRAPIRLRGWSNEAWIKACELTAGRPDDNRRSQGQLALLLDGLDLRLAKAFAMHANVLAFDLEGKRLLLGQYGLPEKPPTTVVTLGDLAGQSGSTEKRFASFGVVGFGLDGSARYLEVDPADRSSLLLRDAITGREIRRLRSPRAGVTGIMAHAFARDGSRAAGIVWPLRKRTLEEMAELEDKNDEMTTEGESATLVVWDISTAQVLLAEPNEQKPSHDVMLSPDGTLLASWDGEGRQHDVAVWAVNDGTLLGRISSTRSGVTSVAFGRDPIWRVGEKGPAWRLAIGERGGMITVWDLKTRAVKILARGSAYDIKTIDFSPDGTLLASAGRNELRIWDAASGACLLRSPAGSSQTAVAFSPDGRRLALGQSPDFGWRAEVDVYDLEEGRGLRTLRGLQQRIEKVAISADCRRIAALSNDSEVGVFDKDSGTLIGVVEAPEGDFPDNAALALNAEGTRLMCSAGTKAKLWDVEKKRLLREWAMPPALTEAAAFRPDGRLTLIRQETLGRRLPPYGSVDPQTHPRVCRAYELREQGEPRILAEIPDFDWYVEHIAVTPDAGHFAIQGSRSNSGKLERILHVYDGTTGKSVGTIPTTLSPSEGATTMRFDPKGTRLHVRMDGSDRDRHDLFEVPSLKPLGPVMDVKGMNVMSVNVGGSRWLTLFSQTPDTPEMLVLNERGRGAPLLRIVRDVGVHGTDGIKFSPDGNFLVWGNQDGTVTVCALNEVQQEVGSRWTRLGVRRNAQLRVRFQQPMSDSMVEGRSPKSSTE